MSRSWCDGVSHVRRRIFRDILGPHTLEKAMIGDWRYFREMVNMWQGGDWMRSHFHNYTSHGHFRPIPALPAERPIYPDMIMDDETLDSWFIRGSRDFQAGQFLPPECRDLRDAYIRGFQRAMKEAG